MRLPTDQNRTTIIGSTGSGKTQFACWLLSSRDFHRKPWIIFDFKRDELIGELDAKEIPITGKPPKKPGLYVVRLIPGTQDDAIEKFLWLCYHQERIGLYIDEGYSVDKNSKALRAILTQGRSKRIPVICLSQRPNWISRFILSEASFFAVFRLTDEDDIVTVKRFIGKTGRALVNQGLPEYNCVWFDVGGGSGNGAVTLLRPVPQAPVIIDAINRRLNSAPRKQKVV